MLILSFYLILAVLIIFAICKILREGAAKTQLDEKLQTTPQQGIKFSVYLFCVKKCCAVLIKSSYRCQCCDEKQNNDIAPLF